MSKDLQFVDVHRQVNNKINRAEKQVIPGFTLTQKTRPLVIAKLEEFIRNKIIKIYSPRLLNELKTFVWNNNKPEAMRGYNDDLVMALAIACWVRDTALTVNQRDVEYRKALMSSIVKGGTTLNTTIPGMKGHKSVNRTNQAKQAQEFAWLYKG